MVLIFISQMSSVKMDPEIEKEAVKHFVTAFVKWDTEQVAITKLMGKKSQASPDVRNVVGKTEKDFIKFLNRHPYVFSIKGETVMMLNTSDQSDEGSEKESDEEERSVEETLEGKSEDDAIQYFRDVFLKIGCKEITAKSLFKRKAQAPVKILDIIGTKENEFVTFLKRHPSIFTLTDGVVKLTEKTKKTSTLSVSRAPTLILCRTDIEQKAIDFFRTAFSNQTDIEISQLGAMKAQAPPDINMALGDIQDTYEFLKNHGKHFVIKGDMVSLASGDGVSKKNLQKQQEDTLAAVLAANQRAAIAYLREAIQKEGKKLTLHALSQYLAVAPLCVQQVTGTCPADVYKFLRLHTQEFSIDAKWRVSVFNSGVRDHRQVKVLSTDQLPSAEDDIVDAVGIINRLMPSCGFLTYNNCSCVYFGLQSCIDIGLCDLTKVYSIGEALHFDAVPGGPDATCEWRATRVSRQKLPPVTIPVVCSQPKIKSQSCSYSNYAAKIVQQKLEAVGSISLESLQVTFGSDKILKDNIGSTIAVVLATIQAHPDKFAIQNGNVYPRCASKKTMIVTGAYATNNQAVSNPVDTNCLLSLATPTLVNQRGKIIRLFEQLGFLEFTLGRVFFHRAQFQWMDYNVNLLEELNVGDWLCFNCTEGKPGSKAKWAATKVWYPGDNVCDMSIVAQDGSGIQHTQDAIHRDLGSSLEEIFADELNAELDVENDESFPSIVPCSDKNQFDVSFQPYTGLNAEGVASCWLPSTKQDYINPASRLIPNNQSQDCTLDTATNQYSSLLDDQKVKKGLSSRISHSDHQLKTDTEVNVKEDDPNNVSSRFEQCMEIISSTQSNVLPREMSSVEMGSNSASEGECVLSNKKGQLMKVLSSFGILRYDSSLVYFDQSDVWPEVVPDTSLDQHLTQHEWLWFDAVLAPAGSVCRWKATKVWQQDDHSATTLKDFQEIKSGNLVINLQ